MSSKFDWERSRKEQLVRTRGADPISKDNRNFPVAGPAQLTTDELSAAILKYAKSKSTLPEFLRMLELSGFYDRNRNLRILKEKYRELYESLKRGADEPFAQCPQCRIWIVAKRLPRHIQRAHGAQ